MLIILISGEGLVFDIADYFRACKKVDMKFQVKHESYELCIKQNIV